MQVATITATGQQVEIVAVNGGWTTVHTLDADTREMKVRNGALSKPTTMSGLAGHLAMQKAEKARIVREYKADGTGPVAEAKKARAKKPVEERLNGVVYAGYLPQYQSYKVECKDGTIRRSVDKGDGVAHQLRGLPLTDVYKQAARITGISVSGLMGRFEHLNPGMQRMNLGNMIRKVYKDQAAKGAN